MQPILHHLPPPVLRLLVERLTAIRRSALLITIPVLLFMSAMFAPSSVFAANTPTHLPTNSAIKVSPTSFLPPVINVSITGGQLSGRLTHISNLNAFLCSGIQFSAKISDITARLLNPEYFSVAGEQTSSGFIFPVKGIPSGTGQRITMITFGYCPVNNEEIIAVGTPTTLYTKEHTSHPNGILLSSTKKNPQPFDNWWLPSVTFNMETYFTDPAFIQLNYVIDTINCNYTSTTVYNCSGGDTR